MSAPTAPTATSSAPAATSLAGTWQIDSAHSGVDFTVTHMMISKVRGRLSDITGTLVTDGTAGDSQISVEIGTASIDTREASRDTHLRSPDFFDVEQFPTISFRSTAVKAKSGDEYSVTGQISMHGVTKTIEIDVTNEGAGRDPWGGDRLGFSSTFTVDRRDFGLTWNQALEAGGLLVSNTVKITVDLQLTRKA